MARLTVATLTHGEQLYRDLLAVIRQDQALVSVMWHHAQSTPQELDLPGTWWTVAVTRDGTPAAWCAARITDGGILRCHSNYEVPAHRGRGLYEAVYHRRHQDVVQAHPLTAVTYLFAQPIALHRADNWRTTGLTGLGELGHRWWELRRDRGACRA